MVAVFPNGISGDGVYGVDSVKHIVAVGGLRRPVCSAIDSFPNGTAFPYGIGHAGICGADAIENWFGAGDADLGGPVDTVGGFQDGSVVDRIVTGSLVFGLACSVIGSGGDIDGFEQA